MKKFKLFLISLLALLMVFSVGTAAACSGGLPTLKDTPSVTLDQTKLKMEIGSSVQLTATLKDFAVGNVPEVEWKSFDQEIASVDQDGKVTALGNGTTTVVAQAGTYSASCDITVLESVVERNDVNVSLSQNTAVLNADSTMANKVTITAVVTVNGVIVNADVSWQSSDTEYATVENGVVTALKNGKEVIITASITYSGSTVTSICRVVLEGFAAIIPAQTEIEIYPTETKQIEFDLYVAGVLAPEEKANVTYSVENQGVAKVSKSGLITALTVGTTKVSVNYGNRSAELTVRVGDIFYVQTAEQLMAMNNAKKLNKYILTDNIDLSAYFIEKPATNGEYLFESFDGELIGNGYTVSGYHRYATSKDGGFYGLIKEIGENAVIDGVHIKAEIEIKDAASLIAANNYGTIKNSLFEVVGATAFNKRACLFEISNGSVENTVFKIDYKESVAGVINVQSNGYGTCENVYVVSTDTLGKEIEGTAIYATESALVSANVLDANVFSTTSGIELKDDGNGKTITYPEISVDGEYLTAEVGVAVTIKTQNYLVFNESGKNVTDDYCAEDKFTPATEGIYYVLHYAENSGVYKAILKEIKVVKTIAQINGSSVVLKPNQTFTVTVSGKAASDFDYSVENSAIATVNGGVITAVKEGVTTVMLIEKATGTSYKVMVSVVSEFVEIASKEQFLAIREDTEPKYYVLTEDLAFTDEDLIEEENVNGEVVTYKEYIINNFIGTLDGQGHKITLTISHQEGSALVGLIDYLARGAMIRNLVYDANLTFTPYDKQSYQAAFIGTCAGKMENCYIKGELHPTRKPSDGFGLIGYLQCESGFPQTATITNSVFDLKIIYGGEVLDNGYAVRVGFNPFGYVYDSIFIKNGITATFFGDHGVNGSAVECHNAYFYKTVYDFVNANNGYKFSTGHVANKINDGEQLYLGWSNVWTIKSDAIYLCGRKVTDVSHESYVESRAIAISGDKGVINWISDATEFEVIVNGKLATKTIAKTFDIYSYVLETYGAVNGVYNVFIKAAGSSGVCVFRVTELNNENFVQVLKEIDTKEEAEFDYFVLSENVTVNWTKGGSHNYMVNNSYLNIDGRGYSLTVNGKGAIPGLMHTSYGLWTNVVIKINATYEMATVSNVAFIAGSVYTGGFVNCYIMINDNSTDANGNPVTHGYAVVFGYPSNAAKYEDNLFVLNGSANTVICPFGSSSSGGPNLVNCAVVRNTASHDMTPGFGDLGNKGIINTVHYQTYDDFISGVGMNYYRPVNTTKDPEIKPIKVPVYSTWDSVWEISAEGIKLCGRTIVQSVQTGDDLVSDSDIPEI